MLIKSKIFISFIVLQIIFFGCSEDNDSKIFLFERYSQTNNDNVLSLERKNNKIEISFRRTVYDYNDGYENFIGNFYLENGRMVCDVQSSIRKDRQKFEFLHLSNSYDTLILPDLSFEGKDKNKSYTILDTSFYSVSYQDTIFKNTIYNFGYLIHSDVMSLFIGKKVGIVGRYVILDNQILNINGNIFHDIFEKQYKQYSYYPRVE